ncbi:LysR substrate-binding domain-containing protein [Pseudomonas mangiferae]|uniref:LysR family transcriptional regulator n=1 Tax=Pseudomonas mangiferae TaxID=2593654 RepID=A0A553GZN1_9PSED|nr:LysR substrate-binding domain-containing protein [Pseudomonas mangiferae]TRX74962.1 LysR family transcriptional regulator [Pseudomonas mangiferae]
MRFDLSDLRLFLHIVEAQSITAGAERACLALASASARIKTLEDALGTPLLERHRRGVRPTPAGRALEHHARGMLYRLELLVGDLGRYAQGLRGRVRLLANTAALTEYLPDPLGAFLLEQPHLDVVLEERPSHAIAEALLRQQADLGILAAERAPEGLESRPFREDRLVCIVTRGDPRFADRRRVRFSELLEQAFVGLTGDNALQQHLTRKAAQAGGRLNLRVRLAGFEPVCRLVGQGVGIGIVPETAARRWRSIGVRRLRLDEPWALRQLRLCAPSFDALSPHARALADHLAPTREG